MPKGPFWSKDEDATVTKAVLDGLTPEGASALLPGRTPKSCRTRARILETPFPKQKAKPSSSPRSTHRKSPHQTPETWAACSARAKAERAETLEAAHRLGIDTALPWRTVVQAVRDQQKEAA